MRCHKTGGSESDAASCDVALLLKLAFERQIQCASYLGNAFSRSPPVRAERDLSESKGASAKTD